MANNKFSFTKPSETIEIHLSNGQSITGPRGAPVAEFMELAQSQYEDQIVGAVINGELRELVYPIQKESDVVPVTVAMPDGMRIYRRTLTFLLGFAFRKLFPGADIKIDHSVSFGGYYCEVENRHALSEDEISALKNLMDEIISENGEIIRKEVPIKDAIKYFINTNQPDKVKLLKHRKKDFIMLHFYGDYCDYHHGYMLPSSGGVKLFDIQNLGEGFALRFPRRHNPNVLMPLGDYPKLIATFRQYGDWLERLGIDSVGALNDTIQDGRIRETILVSEALHEQRIVDIATRIADRRDEIRVVLVAGPSSSGKTTSSRRLSVQLLAYGIHPYPLEMDNFFVDRDRTPRDKRGEFDFEHIDAINIPRLNHDLKKLISAEEVQLPHYDFHTGISGPGEVVKLQPGQVIIVEGIHGLNPKLISEVPESQIYRVYLSALTQLNFDRHNRVSTTDTRLIRRIVRDARTRGYSPQETIRRWESVRRGEKQNIFPYQENANVLFNSALVYELAALKPMAEPLLRQVPFGTPEHIEVKRLLAILDWFLPLDTSLIPDNSLLREFIGGSILEDFSLWKNE
ncbi:MAG: nucleoside kinase [Anaerolineae bacterium]|nr:nucleoside kinase [Anaerolineae bacterium]